MNTNYAKWVIGILSVVFILSIADLNKIKSIAEIIGGLGSFLAFLGAIWIWQKSEINNKIKEARAIFAQWYCLCMSCKDINSPQNYLTTKSYNVYFPDFKEFDNLVYLYELHIDKDYPGLEQIEKHYEFIKNNLSQAINAGWKSINLWANTTYETYWTNVSNAINILNQNGVEVPENKSILVSEDIINQINSIINDMPSFQKVVATANMTYEYLLNSINILSDPVRTLLINNRVINLYNLLNFKHEELHTIRFISFTGGYSQYCSQNNINFSSDAIEIINMGKKYTQYLKSKLFANS